MRLKLTSDRTVLSADGQDLSFITVEAVDDKGRLQMNSTRKVRFTISGTGTIAAVGSGDGQSLDSYSGDSFNLFNGRALIVLRTSRKAGQIKLKADADGLTASSLQIQSRPASSLSEVR